MADTPDPLTPFLQAISHFKDWSNYLLVTTPAALGWASTHRKNIIKSAYYLSIFLFALSIIFGIFTLVMIPLVTEKIKAGVTSIYEIKVSFNLPWWSTLFQWHDQWPEWLDWKLKDVCFWQHLFFILGIVTYSLGARYEEAQQTLKRTLTIKARDAAPRVEAQEGAQRTLLNVPLQASMEILEAPDSQQSEQSGPGSGWIGRWLPFGPASGSRARTLAASGRPDRGGRDG